jgi:hypothetical protein
MATPASAWLVMNTGYGSRARLGATRGGSLGILG